MPGDTYADLSEQAIGLVRDILQKEKETESKLPGIVLPEKTHYFERKDENKAYEGKISSRDNLVATLAKIEDIAKKTHGFPAKNINVGGVAIQNRTPENFTDELKNEVTNLKAQLQTIYDSLLKGESQFDDKYSTSPDPKKAFTKAGVDEVLDKGRKAVQAKLAALEASLPDSPADDAQKQRVEEIKRFIADKRKELQDLPADFEKNVSQLSSDLNKHRQRIDQHFWARRIAQDKVFQKRALWIPKYPNAQEFMKSEEFMKKLMQKMERGAQNRMAVGEDFDYAQALKEVMEEYLKDTCYFRRLSSEGDNYILKREKQSDGSFVLRIEFLNDYYPKTQWGIKQLFEAVLDFQSQTGTAGDTIEVSYSGQTTDYNRDARIQQLITLVDVANNAQPPRMVELSQNLMKELFDGHGSAKAGDELTEKLEKLKAKVEQYKNERGKELGKTGTPEENKEEKESLDEKRTRQAILENKRISAPQISGSGYFSEG